MPFDGAEFFSPSPRRARWRDLLPRAFRAPAPPPGAALLRVLEEARGLIAEREDWTQGAYTTHRGERCAVGALRDAASLLGDASAGLLAFELLREVARERGYPGIEVMNDRSRHASVLSAFDAAIEAAERRPVVASGETRHG
jgi:hypothetical protein